MILQCPASEEATKLEIAKITESIKTFTNSSISQENPYQDITFLMQCSISPFTHPKTDNNASPITAWMSSCLIIYILQLSLFGTGVYYSRQSGSSRLFKRHDSGIIIPNTRILVATFSACLSIALIIDTILLILNANGSSTFNERAVVAGIKWLPLWLGGWVYTWGIATSVFISSYGHPIGSLGRLTGKSHSAIIFNAIFIGMGAFLLIAEAAGSGLIAATLFHSFKKFGSTLKVFEQLASDARAQKPIKLSKSLDGFIALNKDFYFRLFNFLMALRFGCSLFLALLSIMFFIIHIKFVRSLKLKRKISGIVTHAPVIDVSEFNNKKTNETTEDEIKLPTSLPQKRRPSIEKLIVSSQSRLNGSWGDAAALVFAAMLSISHILVYVLMVITYTRISEVKRTPSSRAYWLTNVALVNNTIFSLTGFLSNWVFWHKSRQTHFRMLYKEENISESKMKISPKFSQYLESVSHNKTNT